MKPEDLATLLTLLEATHTLDPSSAEFLAVERAASHLEKAAKKKRKLARKHKSRAEDSAIVTTHRRDHSQGGQPLNQERHCYVCKLPFRRLHHWYTWVCPACGDRCEALKQLPMDLRGRRALLTGGRIKIGHATALRMLRAGAEVHVTTRFPNDARQRYALEPDARTWSARLHVHGLDLRDLGALLRHLEVWSHGPAFDILINNAAQSVWHPPEYFHALRARESPPDEAVAPLALPLLQLNLAHLDAHREDSWVQNLGEVQPIDMVEVQVVNAIAPFLLVNRLLDNLRRSSFSDRYVVNVTAVEGQFDRSSKPPRHPHTNMAKAGLNMLTRTCSAELRNEGIFMVSVDPGWMSREGRNIEPGFEVPLDAADCAARVLHPIASGLAGLPLCGVLLKDFVEVPW